MKVRKNKEVATDRKAAKLEVADVKLVPNVEPVIKTRKKFAKSKSRK